MVFISHFWSSSSQCNKKNSNDGAGSHQEKDEVSGQVGKQEYIHSYIYWQDWEIKILIMYL